MQTAAGWLTYTETVETRGIQTHTIAHTALATTRIHDKNKESTQIKEDRMVNFYQIAGCTIRLLFFLCCCFCFLFVIVVYVVCVVYGSSYIYWFVPRLYYTYHKITTKSIQFNVIEQNNIQSNGTNFKASHYILYTLQHT